MNDASENVAVSKTFAAPAQRVYDAFLHPSTAGEFMFATPDGQMLRAEVDPRVGGAFRFTERRAQFDADHVGTFLELARPTRIVFEFAAGKLGEVGPDRTPVTITIEPEGNQCRLTLSHPLPPQFSNFRDKTIQGWQTILNRLAEVLASASGKCS